MSWLDRRLPRLAAVLGLALGLAGCFQPLYAERTLTSAPIAAGGPALPSGTTLQAVMSAIDIKDIDGRIGQNIRNELIFAFTGGGAPSPQRLYRLEVRLAPSLQAPIVDPYTDRAEVETVVVDAWYQLVPTGQIDPVIKGNAFGRASFNRSRQRYATIRAQRDAEDRAAKLVAEQIRLRLTSYFSTGQ